MTTRIVSRADERLTGLAVEHRAAGEGMTYAESFVAALRPLVDGRPLHVRGRVRTTTVRIGDEWELSLRGHQWLVRMDADGAFSAADHAELHRLFWVLPEEKCDVTWHRAYGGACCYCCDSCNYGRHLCHFCGEPLRHDGREWAAGDVEGEIHPCMVECRYCGVIGHEHPRGGAFDRHLYAPRED